MAVEAQGTTTPEEVTHADGMKMGIGPINPLGDGNLQEEQGAGMDHPGGGPPDEDPTDPSDWFFFRTRRPEEEEEEEEGKESECTSDYLKKKFGELTIKEEPEEAEEKRKRDHERSKELAEWVSAGSWCGPCGPH